MERNNLAWVDCILEERGWYKRARFVSPAAPGADRPREWTGVEASATAHRPCAGVGAPGGPEGLTMQIDLYNTMTRRQEALRPIDEKNVRMYVCGPTVYDRAHIGNARPVVVFDTLFRLLRHVYGEKHVTYVRNITDVEDKIIAAAAENEIGRAHV